MQSEQKDRDILRRFREEKPWGLLCSVDMKGCNAETIRNEKSIKDFVDKLCRFIDMKKFGETYVVNFGEDPRVSGFSMTQFIETSLISGHFVNQTNSVYIDIFSCKEYSPDKVGEFCKEYFEANDITINILFRY